MTAIGVILFEDERVLGFGPLIATRPAFELRVGCLNLRERVEIALPTAARRTQIRPELLALLSKSLPDWSSDSDAKHWIALNARAHGNVPQIHALLQAAAAGEGAMAVDGQLLCAWGPAERVQETIQGKSPLTARELPDAPELMTAPWDLVAANGKAIADDALFLRDAAPRSLRSFGIIFEDDHELRYDADAVSFAAIEAPSLFPGVHLVAADDVLIGKGTVVKPGVVLDASNGAIVIGPGCRIEANVTIIGPAYVGAGSVVNPGAKLREGTSLGALCKVGGEIEESIFLDASNKQHDGFIGHAYLGSWVNLGAATNASDLKNNYGNVRVDMGDGPVDSGSRFVGPTIGDHVKTGINTMLTTGAVIGLAANVFGAGFPPRWIPPFSWGGMDGGARTRIDECLSTARIVLGRRGAQFLSEHEELIRLLYEK